MNIYVLSLPDDHQRREALELQFPRYAPKFRFIDAVDGRSASPITDIPPCAKDRHRPLTGPEIACSLGHLKIFQSIVESKANPTSFHLILEDDVIGDCGRLEKIGEILLALPPKSLAILGGLQGMSRARHLHGFKSSRASVYRIPELQRRNLSRTCCYAVDFEMAKHLLQQQQRCLHRADDWAALLKGEYNVFYSPVLAHPTADTANSHIEQGRSHQYNGGLIKRWYQDGWKESIGRPLTRIFTPFLARYLHLHRIHQGTEIDRPSA
ncbi:glycosyltransferase family 25 protein [Marinobacter mobilis]|uniref:Glycosyl transferase, family 25 n=1 Tax=Marinobacter mobilis TaxID=488533 RepID=A0A1H2TJA4_9GAMM|nr:glycosyl transferase, family 25 [Marinobacter mobilis]